MSYALAVLLQRPQIVILHCPKCGQPVTIEYYADITTDSVPEPQWHCPHIHCSPKEQYPLIGARLILSVRPRFT